MSFDPWSGGSQFDPDEMAEMAEIAYAEAEERTQRVKTLWRRFGWLANEARSLWGPQQAHDLLADALTHFKPPKRKKGVHDPEFNDAMLAAYRAAPEGKKMAAVIALGAEHRLSPETATRRWRRLLQRRKAARQNLGEWAPTGLQELP
jgi:hypothetical protein